jgi:MFS family permease
VSTDPPVRAPAAHENRRLDEDGTEPPPSDVDTARLERARWATAGVFLLLGMLLGTWFSGVPRFQRQLSVEPTALGLLLLAPTIGSLIGMQVAGRLVSRFGGGPVVRATAVTLPFTLPLVAVTDYRTAAGAALLLFGVVDGVQGVAMNVHGITVERGLRRPVLSGMHAAWGAGALLGGAIGTGAVAFGLSLFEHFAIVAVVTAVVGAVAGRYLLPHDGDESSSPDENRGRVWRHGWTRPVIALGLMGAGVMVCEVGISSWGAIFLGDERNAAAVLASAGFVVFTAAETGTRLVGDRLNRRLGPVAVVRWSAIIGLLGLALIVLAPSVPVNLAGFLVFGVGLAVINPIIFSAVGHGSTSSAGPGVAIARYTTLTYIGVLGGPALIGGLANAIGLTAALACMAVPLAAIAIGARLTAAATPH